MTTMWKSVSVSVVVALIAVGFAGSLGTSMVLDATNTTEFCTSCHSMQWNTEEWMESTHYTNVSGVRADCADCHVPRNLGPKLFAKLMAARDVWGEISGRIDSKEKFEAHRWDLASRVWDRMKANDSRECRTCHTYDAMDLEEQDRSARKKHHSAPMRGKSCIDCHKGVAHKMPRRPKKPKKDNTEALNSLSDAQTANN